jgi:plasmid stability protein
MTVRFETKLHKALRLKAADTGRSVSEIVCEAIRDSLHADEIDLATIAARANEKTISYEELVRRLKANGTL